MSRTGYTAFGEQMDVPGDYHSDVVHNPNLQQPKSTVTVNATSSAETNDQPKKRNADSNP